MVYEGWKKNKKQKKKKTHTHYQLTYILGRCGGEIIWVLEISPGTIWLNAMERCCLETWNQNLPQKLGWLGFMAYQPLQIN